MLLLPRTCRESFWAAKLTSLVAFEQLKTPMGGRSAPGREARAARKPATVRSSASSHVAGRSSPPFVSRTRGWVRRTYDFGTVPPLGSSPAHLAGPPSLRGSRRRPRRRSSGWPQSALGGRDEGVEAHDGDRELDAERERKDRERAEHEGVAPEEQRRDRSEGEQDKDGPRPWPAGPEHLASAPDDDACRVDRHAGARDGDGGTRIAGPGKGDRRCERFEHDVEARRDDRALADAHHR